MFPTLILCGYYFCLLYECGIRHGKIHYILLIFNKAKIETKSLTPRLLTPSRVGVIPLVPESTLTVFSGPHCTVNKRYILTMILRPYKVRLP